MTTQGSDISLGTPGPPNSPDYLNAEAEGPVRRLPVRLGPSVRRFGPAGTLLVGGDPLTFLRLTPGVSGLIRAGRLDPEASPVAADLAERLLQNGMAHPESAAVAELTEVGFSQLAIVVPVLNDQKGVDALIAALTAEIAGGARVLVVDDGSDPPISVPAGVEVLRHEVPRGPASARNRGAEAVGRPVVAFLDADCVPQPGWLSPLLALLAEPDVVVAAPRIVAAQPGRWLVRGYETARSALDLGPNPAPIRPRSRVPYVPSAALVVRFDRIPQSVLTVEDAAADRRSLFDESMQVAEDVDLCWRLAASGAGLRYEPSARVAHRHRLALWPLLRRRAFYGSGAAGLAERHGPAVAPAVFTVRGLMVAVLGWWSTPATLLAAALLAGDSVRRVATVTSSTPVAASVVAGSLSAAFWQLPSALLRPYWPVSAGVLLCASAFSHRSRGARRLRQRFMVAAVAEGLHHWWGMREPHRLPKDEPFGHVLVHRLDDLAYGTGVWRSVFQARSWRALRPELRP